MAKGSEMPENFFVLGRFAQAGAPFVGLVVGDRVLPLVEAAQRVSGLPIVSAVDGLLRNWNRNFALLCAVVEGIDAATPMLKLDGLRVLAPLVTAPRVLNAAANYRDHVAGMQKNFTNNLPKVNAATKTPTLEPYLFAKVSPLSGPHDDIILPPGMERIDWEAELAVVIGLGGRNISKDKVAEHIAGYMVGNDVSCRDRTWREDRPAIRSDWLTGKSYESFSPIGPYFVPKAFVPDHANLKIQLWVNGELKQDGNSGAMIFSIEDQIAFASEMLELLPGDVFHTGTPAGTGQERGEFLKVGDVVETEIEFCGRQRNTVVAGYTDYAPTPDEYGPRAILESLYFGDRALFFASLAEDFLCHTPGQSPIAGQFMGSAGMTRHVAQMRELTDGAFKVWPRGELMIAGEFATLPTMVRASRPDGRQIEIEAFGIWRFRDGKVAEHWEMPLDIARFDAFWRDQ